MDWFETKFVLSKYVDEIIIKYQENIMEYGTYGDHVTNYPELSVEKEAQTYINLLQKNEPVNIDAFPLLKQYTAKIVKECNLGNDPDKHDRNLAQVAEMLLELKHNRLQLLDELCVSPSFSSEQHKNQFENNSPEQLDDKGITLRQLIDKYIEYKTTKNIWSSPNTIQQRQQMLNYLHEFFEYLKNKKNIQLHELESNDADQFEKQFQMLPTNRTKKYRDIKIKELISKSESGLIPKNDRISATTYNGYVDLLNGIFKFAMEPRQNFIKQNFFIDLKIKKPTNVKRPPFSANDLKLFFSTPLFQKKEFNIQFSWRYWIPILMWYHGCRLEEVAQLQVKNIIKVGKINAIEIKEEYDKDTKSIITKLKNESSHRIIPIHSAVIKIGFLKYVEHLIDNDEQKLFPNLSNVTKNGTYKKAGAKVSRWFNEDDKKNYKYSYLTKCGINADDKERKVLYCFRHTFQVFLHNHPDNIESEKIFQLIGHEPKSNSHKYYSSYNMDTLSKTIELIACPDAKIPWDTNSDYHKIKFPWE